MKKLFALLLSLTMLVALAACGGDKAPSNQGGATTGGLTPDAITQRGVLRVGVKTDVPGFGLLTLPPTPIPALRLIWLTKLPRNWALIKWNLSQ